MNWGRALTVLCGILLIIDGFAGWNVRVAAVVVGLLLIGALPIEWLTDLIAAGRRRTRIDQAEGEQGAPEDQAK